ncbi:MAG: AAA family ATPase [Phocaeicola sp.]
MAGFRTHNNTPTLQEINKVVAADVAAVQEAAKDVKERYKIDLSKEYAEPSYLISSNGVGTIPRGDIIAIKAKSKNGKTFLASIFAAVAIGATWGSLSAKEAGLKVMIADTEQNKRNAARVARRVHALRGIDIHKNSDKLVCYSLRKMDMNKRWQFVSDRIQEERPDLVILDGIADLIADFNNIGESQEIISKLMATSAEYNLAIIFVLHTNKSKDDSNMKGHLGTLSVQKCSDVFEVVKNGSTFNVAETECRNIPISDFSFVLDNDGIPRPMQTQKQLQAVENSAVKEAKLRQTFAEIFSDRDMNVIRYSDLVPLVKLHFAVKDRQADNKITLAKECGIIKVQGDGYVLS